MRSRLLKATTPFCVAVCLAVAAAAAAQAPTTANTPTPTTYGTTSEVYYWIPATEFTPDRTGFGLAIDSANYFHAEGSDPNPFFFATVRLPNGAVWDGVTVYYNDSDAGNNMEFLIDRSSISLNTSTQVTQVFSSGTPGYTSSFLAVPALEQTINNSDNFYQVAFNIGISPTLQFRAARVEYHLQVSPAPGTAFFNDVPTSDFGFQFVEAFAAAGITVGCTSNPPFTPPVYCPDRNVTRREMAIFFAKALGLHFPN